MHLIYLNMNEFTKEEVIAILNDESKTTVQKYEALYGEKVTRDKAKYALNKLRNKLGLLITHKLSTYRKITMNEDGSQASELVIDCPESKLKDANYLLEVHGYDPTKFELVHAQSSLWQAGVKQTKQLYASKIKVRPITIQNDVVNLLNEAVQKHNPHAFIPDNNVKISSRVLEICLPDLHFGLTEDDGDQLTTRASETVKVNRIASSINDFIVTNDITEVNLVFLGDILHYDTDGKTTTHGIPQNSHLTFQQMFDSAVEHLTVIIDAIYAGLDENDQNSSFTITYVPGNHDKLLGYTVMATLKAIYNHEIIFDIEQKSRKFVLYGCNLVGYTHGDMNKKRMQQWIYNEAKQFISDAENIEVHAGHYHSENTIEDNGIILRYLSTSAGVSPWEYEQGYHSKRKVEMFLWDKTEGLQSINFINLF